MAWGALRCLGAGKWCHFPLFILVTPSLCVKVFAAARLRMIPVKRLFSSQQSCHFTCSKWGA